jgi:FKBP-type peptidyl-prolyl cis-trans isomerase
VTTNQQRREAERRRLQKQLEERRAREAARKRFTLVASIVGTLVVIAVVITVIALTAGGSDNKNNAAGDKSSPTVASSSPAPSSSTASQQPLPPAPTAPCAGVPKGATATFQGVTVTKATDIKHEPKVTSKSTAAPANLVCQDLIVGKGKAATTASTVTVQYIGVLYKDGKQFDSSWTRGQPAQFPLNQVVPGFTEGIGGAGKVAPMKVGGRRIMILPSSLAYGSTAQNGIPANSTLVFVVDLKSIDH